MANWIVDGDPGLDLWPFDVRRFGTPHSVKAFMYERAVESYARYYHIAWPNRRARRRPRRAPQSAARDAARRRAPSTATSSAGSGPTGSAKPERGRSTCRSFDRGPAFEADRRRASRRARARRAHRHELVLEIRGARSGRARAVCRSSPATISIGRWARSSTRSFATSAAASRPTSRSPGSRRTASTSSPAARFGVRDRATIERHMPRRRRRHDRRPHLREGRAQPLRPARARRARAR